MADSTVVVDNYAWRLLRLHDGSFFFLGVPAAAGALNSYYQYQLCACAVALSCKNLPWEDNNHRRWAECQYIKYCGGQQGFLYFGDKPATADVLESQIQPAY